MIYLAFANPVRYGGHVTFTNHLLRQLQAHDEVELVVLHHRTESFKRDFKYGLEYRNVHPSDLTEGPVLITAPSKPKRDLIDIALDNGAGIVIHDPAEFKHGWDLTKIQQPPIVIRKSMLEHLPDARFIRHPYIPANPEIPDKTKLAVSTSRIDFDKHTELLLDANRLVANKDEEIDIRGFENRIYTRFNILPHYPEWKQSVAAYPKTFRAGMELCLPYVFMCDMSIIKGDGGGTQYTFLEAMDAGACCIVNREWLRPKDAMWEGVNCFAVSSGMELAYNYLRKYRSSRTFREMVRQATVNARGIFPLHDTGEEFFDAIRNW